MKPVMIDGTPYRPWVGRYQWPEKKPFLFGTAFLPLEITDQELQKLLDEKFAQAWQDILPDHYERPKLLAYIPGAIFFVKDDEI